jgi:hypothetical protein
MQVFHIEGAPPKRGNNIFATSGCTQKSKVALVKRPAANSGPATASLIEGLVNLALI